MNFKAFLLLLIVVVTFSVTFANTNQAMKEAEQKRIFANHAKVVEAGLLGRTATVGGPRFKLGRPQVPAHSHMKQGRF